MSEDDATQEYAVTITDLAFGGDGVGRHDGKVVFVRGALPGEEVLVRTWRDQTSYCHARLVRVVRAAAERVAPACPLALRAAAAADAPATSCPGCAYQHLSCASETAWKERQLKELLARVAGVAVADEAWLPPVAGQSALGYRNKLTLHSARTGDGRPVLGYFGEDNATVLDVPNCPLAHPEINVRLGELRKDAGFRRKLRPGMTWTWRRTERDGVVVWPDRPRRRDPWLQEATPWGPAMVPRGSFFQVNPEIAAALATAVADRLRELSPRRLLDVYCGCGLFSLAAGAAGIAEVIGIDGDATAIAAAQANAGRQGLERFRFVAASAEKALPGMLSAWPDAALIVDPPRAGLSSQARTALAVAKPPFMIYVSCAPDTLARDLRHLATHGYQLRRIQLFDMFPRTSHFETMAVLNRSTKIN